MNVRIEDHPMLMVLNRGTESPQALRILPVESKLKVVYPSLVRALRLAGADAGRRFWNLSQSMLAWSRTRVAQKRKRLRICESVSLGEKRFVAVIQVDGEQFLVGGAANSLAMLAQLDSRRTFADVLTERAKEQSTA